MSHVSKGEWKMGEPFVIFEMACIVILVVSICHKIVLKIYFQLSDTPPKTTQVTLSLSKCLLFEKYDSMEWSEKQNLKDTTNPVLEFPDDKLS